MKKITLREDENLFIISDRQVKDLREGLVFLIKHLDDAFEKDGSMRDKALADREDSR